MGVLGFLLTPSASHLYKSTWSMDKPLSNKTCKEGIRNRPIPPEMLSELNTQTKPFFPSAKSNMDRFHLSFPSGGLVDSSQIKDSKHKNSHSQTTIKCDDTMPLKATSQPVFHRDSEPNRTITRTAEPSMRLQQPNSMITYHNMDTTRRGSVTSIPNSSSFNPGLGSLAWYHSAETQPLLRARSASIADPLNPFGTHLASLHENHPSTTFFPSMNRYTAHFPTPGQHSPGQSQQLNSSSVRDSYPPIASPYSLTDKNNPPATCWLKHMEAIPSQPFSRDSIPLKPCNEKKPSSGNGSTEISFETNHHLEPLDKTSTFHAQTVHSNADDSKASQYIYPNAYTNNNINNCSMIDPNIANGLGFPSNRSVSQKSSQNRPSSRVSTSSSLSTTSDYSNFIQSLHATTAMMMADASGDDRVGFGGASIPDFTKELPSAYSASTPAVPSYTPQLLSTSTNEAIALASLTNSAQVNLSDPSILVPMAALSGSRPKSRSENLRPPPGPSPNNRKIDLYKTEICRSWEEKGFCAYEERCQFAHGLEELRSVERHPLYKTVLCKTFKQTGSCPYAKRCCFRHDEGPSAPSSKTLSLHSRNTQKPLITRVGLVPESNLSPSGSKVMGKHRMGRHTSEPLNFQTEISPTTKASSSSSLSSSSSSSSTTNTTNNSAILTGTVKSSRIARRNTVDHVGSTTTFVTDDHDDKPSTNENENTSDVSNLAESGCFSEKNWNLARNGTLSRDVVVPFKGNNHNHSIIPFTTSSSVTAHFPSHTTTAKLNDSNRLYDSLSTSIHLLKQVRLHSHDDQTSPPPPPALTSHQNK